MMVRALQWESHRGCRAEGDNSPPEAKKCGPAGSWQSPPFTEEQVPAHFRHGLTGPKKQITHITLPCLSQLIELFLLPEKSEQRSVTRQTEQTEQTSVLRQAEQTSVLRQASRGCSCA